MHRNNTSRPIGLGLRTPARTGSAAVTGGYDNLPQQHCVMSGVGEARRYTCHA